MYHREGAEIYGEVKNSVIGAGVIIEEGAVVRDSIVMQGAVSALEQRLIREFCASLYESAGTATGCG